jgi:hypothetical protein
MERRKVADNPRMRSLLCALALTACSPATAPKARLAGEIMSLGGVAGIVAGASLTGVSSHAKDGVYVFSVVTLIGMITYAIGDLSGP